ncbi:MAG: sporulation protein YunB [Clostridium sp.]|jgi:sporulation protein YunB|nr:sporulation protein YunB [Clostridium sp.]MCI5913612.1 sporulation protein YunB [Christensenella sp.]
MEKSSARPGIVSRKKRFLRTVLFLLVLLIVLLSLSVALLSVNMRPAMTALAIARIRSVAARAMNDAILESMGDETNYARLIQVHESSERVYMLQANTHKMNILAADCAEAAQERIAQMGDQGISIPIGTITGISFLAGKGPSLKVTFSPAGSVQSEFNSEFVSSGINQTLYRVNLLLTASVRLVMPGVSETISVRAEAAIAESIIVGDVPEVYTNVASEEDMLNLIPTETP